MAKKRVAPVDHPDDFDEAFEGATPLEGAGEEVPRVVPDPAKHIFVDLSGSGSYELVEYYDPFGPSRRILFNGVNIEHVGDGENGVWQYRAM